MKEIPLNKEEYDNIWDWFYKEFSFTPSVYEKDWPTIRTTRPHRKFSTDYLWQDEKNIPIHQQFIGRAIRTFVEITPPGESVYALDWQHDAFYYDLREMTVDDFIKNGKTIRTSFIPDGEYFIFMTKDLQHIWFGHPWEQSVTLIGDNLIAAAIK